MCFLDLDGNVVSEKTFDELHTIDYNGGAYIEKDGKTKESTEWFYEKQDNNRNVTIK